MGPRFFSRGNTTGRISACGNCWASMGPRLFSRGNPATLEGLTFEDDASMGPRFFNRGNVGVSVGIPYGNVGFNGAAVFQPRKSVEAKRQPLLNLKLQWGRGFSTAEIRGGQAAAAAESEASMGPRFFNRGNEKRHATHRRFSIRFNGAAVFQPRKFERVVIVVSALCHRFNGAAVFQPRKYRERQGKHLAGDGASMGPRFFNRGNRKNRWSAWPGRYGFNGAAVFQPRKCLESGRDSQTDSSFNGAAVFQPRKFDPVRKPGWYRVVLQWGRGFSTAEMAHLANCCERCP